MKRSCFLFLFQGGSSFLARGLDYISTHQVPAVNQDGYGFTVEKDTRFASAFRVKVQVRFAGISAIAHLTQQGGRIYTLTGRHPHTALFHVCEYDLNALAGDQHVVACQVLPVRLPGRKVFQSVNSDQYPALAGCMNRGAEDRVTPQVVGVAEKPGAGAPGIQSQDVEGVVLRSNPCVTIDEWAATAVTDDEFSAA